MQAPQQIQPRGLAGYLEVMSKSVFQTGISWRVVEAQWPGIHDAFRGFDPDALAALTPDDLDALAQDTRIIRNRRKIEAILTNSRTMQALEHQHGSFPAYLRSHGEFEALVKDLRKRFKFVGDMGAYHFLWVVGEPVPPYEEWRRSRGITPPADAHSHG